jgi:hypothetical protein
MGVLAIMLAVLAVVDAMWFSDYGCNGVIPLSAIALAMGTFGFAEKGKFGNCRNGVWTGRRWLHSLKMVSCGLLLLLIICFVVCFATDMIVAGSKGVVESNPILELRGKYLLRSHSQLTEVSRSVYITAGICEEVCFAAFVIMFAQSGIHVALFGSWDWLMGKEGKEKKAGVKWY